MTIEFGTTYGIASSHITCEEITPWSDGTFTVDGDAFANFDRVTLTEIEQSESRFGAVLADLIRTQLLSVQHDRCDYPWKPGVIGKAVHRSGPCPTCGKF